MYPFTNIPYLENMNSLEDIKYLKSKYLFIALKDKIQELWPKAGIHWVTVYSNQVIDFHKCYMTRVKNIKDVKLAEFNFKFYHKILTCEYNLFKWKNQDNYQCTFCNTTSESVHTQWANYVILASKLLLARPGPNIYVFSMSEF